MFYFNIYFVKESYFSSAFTCTCGRLIKQFINDYFVSLAVNDNILISEHNDERSNYFLQDSLHSR